MPAAAIASHDDQLDSAPAIAAFAAKFSIEVTRPAATDLEALQQAAPAGTHVYISALPTRPIEESAAIAASLRRLGFEPVPHLAARYFASPQALDDLLARLAGEAGVRRLLVIGGDREVPQGPYRGALEVIDSGLLTRRGIAEIGIAGYPEGHPRIADHELERLLAAKIEAAEQTGLGVHIVPQFSFDPPAILGWLDRLRDHGVDLPVRVGLAGPTSLNSLMRYARRCGVRAATQGLARNAGLVRHLLGATAPDASVRALAEAGGRLGEIAPHFFSFGGVAATARWVEAVAAGRITLDRTDGFAVARV